MTNGAFRLNFAQALNLTPRDAKAVSEIKSQIGVKWLSSFLTADRRKTFCLMLQGS